MANKYGNAPYEVGKGKPPVHTRFGHPGAPKPGKRPKGSKNTETILRAALSVNQRRHEALIEVDL